MEQVSDYDLDTAEAMFQTKRWLYVGFMCHQTIEKIFKAYWCSKLEGASPMSHNHINIAQSCGLNAIKYPSYKQAIAEGLTKEKCRNLIDKTKSLQIWIKDQL